MVIHNNLYNFWFRSKGVWDSKLAKVTVNLLDEQELSSISRTHHLAKAEFGVNMSWEYKTKQESGQMSWCVDTKQPNVVFTNKGLAKDSSPGRFAYRMIDDNKLVITVGKYEETFFLKDDRRRLRELRYDGKLVRRLWENKVRV